MTPNPANKPTIIVDIDDVIAAHAPAFVEYSNQKWGTNLTIDDYQDHWGEVWRVDYDEREKRAVEYHNSGFIASYGVVDGALTTLKQLKNRYKLVILTTRRRSIDKLTKEWIKSNYPDVFDEIVFSGFFDSPTKESINMTKGEMAKQIGADYLIDDQLKHCVAAAGAGVQALLFGDYKWNRSDNLPVNVTRVKNWQEVLDYFDGQTR